MDGVHDLGGKQGFGPIPIGNDQRPFNFDWEERMWALSCSIELNDITIDWFRHAIERMVPSDYLSFRYFNKWCTTYFMLLLDNKTFAMQEVLSGHTDQFFERAAAKSLDDVLAANRGSNYSFSVAADASPRFAVGDIVTTRRTVATDHTRLPAYARNITGSVIAHHGAHLLPDKGARGIHEGEHLYTVSFTARELWGEDASAVDTVMLELWESYFV